MKVRRGIVLAVKNKKGEYLLLKQKSSGLYSFISGGLEKGESYKDAVIREAKEEVGLEINPDNLIQTDKTIKFNGSRKGPAEQMVFFYNLEKDVELKADNREISGFEWCSKEKAIKKVKNKRPLVQIIKYLEPVNSAFAIICWKNKILLFLRDDFREIPYPNHWTLPGGGVDNGEDQKEAMERELEEEVSYIPRNLKLFKKIKKSAGRDTYLYYAFVDKKEAKRFKLGRMEGQKIGFFTLEEMEKISLVPRLRERLMDNKDSFEKVLKTKSFEGFKL